MGVESIHFLYQRLDDSLASPRIDARMTRNREYLAGDRFCFVERQRDSAQFAQGRLLVKSGGVVDTGLDSPECESEAKSLSHFGRDSDGVLVLC